MQPKIVNKFGTLIGWKAITFNLMGRDVEGITEIEYDDKMAIDNEYGAGDMPIFPNLTVKQIADLSAYVYKSTH